MANKFNVNKSRLYRFWKIDMKGNVSKHRDDIQSRDKNLIKRLCRNENKKQAKQQIKEELEL